MSYSCATERLDVSITVVLDRYKVSYSISLNNLPRVRKMVLQLHLPRVFWCLSS
jgi:hypothetical protein